MKNVYSLVVSRPHKFTCKDGTPEYEVMVTMTVHAGAVRDLVEMMEDAIERKVYRSSRPWSQCEGRDNSLWICRFKIELEALSIEDVLSAAMRGAIYYEFS